MIYENTALSLEGKKILTRGINIMSFEFILNAHSNIGAKTALNLPDDIEKMGFARPGLIIDRNVIRISYVKKVVNALGAQFGKTMIVWEYDIPGEPDYDSLDRVKKLFMRNKKSAVDCFIALGGGSVIDFAKGLATLVVNPGPARTYRGFPTNLKPPLPVIALPTVAGTGSEVTYNASFIDWKEKRKMGINTFHNFPRLSILDPLLTIDCPKHVTISSAMDSLVHALESFATPKANALSTIFSLQAFTLVYHALPKIKKNLRNLQARLELQLSSYLAGIAIVQVGGGPASILSYPLGVHGKVPHGLAGAIVLPYVIEHNVNKGVDYSEIYERIEGASRALSRKQKNILFAKALFDLYYAMNIPSLFSQFTLAKENAQTIMKEIETLQGGFDATSLVPFSVKDAKHIFTQILNSSF